MLEERPNIRRRTGSARSALTRVGSVRPGSGRVSSARPASDTHRPKLHTGRPSSAPVPSRPSSAPPAGRIGSYQSSRTSLGPSSYKSHDVSHLNLKVEGKSIRSVAYTPRRIQPVSRGSLRVIASHGHPFTGRRRQFLLSHKSRSCEKHEVGSDSEGSVGMGFGRTYTLPLAVNQPMIYGSYVTFEHPRDNEAVGLSATYTKMDENKSYVENRLGSTYTLKNEASVIDAEDSELLDRPERRSPDGRIDEPDSVYHTHNSTILSQRNVDHKAILTNKAVMNDMHGLVRDSSYNIRSQLHNTRYRGIKINDDSSHDIEQNGASLLKRDTDTTSNDGSECTVMSLGQRIQLMASIQPKEQDYSKEENWDTEWKQLLRQNHELLLKLSSREDLQVAEDTSDHVKTVFVHDSGVQTTTEDVKEKENFKCMGTVESPEIMLYSEFDGGNEQSQFHRECNRREQQEGRESCTSSESPECVLEDIIEESSHSEKSTPRTVVSNQDNIDNNVKSEGIIPLSLKEIQSVPDISTNKEVLGSVEYESVSKTDSEKEENPPPVYISNSTDFSCTTDLPTYRSGTATAYLVRCRFPREKQLKPQASKDLLEALQMIEDEEKKIPEMHEIGNVIIDKADSETRNESVVYDQESAIDRKQLYSSMVYGAESTDTISSSSYRLHGSKPSDLKKSGSSSLSADCGATLPVLQVLVEKVFLFTQDLAERWKQGSSDGSHEDLLYQLVEAERLLEKICIQEGKKEDPRNSRDLHVKCEEKARKMQEDSDVRIQKNIELIRKLMDDKKLLTEQCELMHRNQKLLEKKNVEKIKLFEERHTQEMKNMKERIMASEQEKREKWTNQKIKIIKESTYRGLETKMKDLSAKHRDEVSQLKAQHWEATREAEEKFLCQLRSQEDDIRKKFEQEKEEACKREREREQQRLEVELRQSEQLALSRMEKVQKQHERDLKSLLEEHHHAQERLHSEYEGALREAVKEGERQRDEYESKIRVLIRSHEDGLAELRHKDEKSRSEWREQFMKEHNEARIQAEKELRERLKRQRDKEIERAIKEIQLETSNHEEQEHRSFEAKIKSLRERYENELNELESSERGARSRYLEMKSLLAQKEEEIVYLRARLHTQDLELCELQHMFQPPD